MSSETFQEKQKRLIEMCWLPATESEVQSFLKYHLLPFKKQNEQKLYSAQAIEINIEPNYRMFPEQETNFVFHNLLFCKTQLKVLLIQYYSFLLKKTNQKVTFLKEQLLENNPIPFSFLYLDDDKKQRTHIESLESKIRFFQFEAKLLKIPKCYFNFREFLLDLLNDNRLETSLSVYVFKFHQILGISLDKFIYFSIQDKFSHFFEKFFSYVQSLLNHYHFSLSEFTDLFWHFYRIVMDRLYETFNFNFPPNSNSCIMDFIQIGSIKFRLDHLETDYFRTFFQNYEGFQKISANLFQACLFNSPYDTLHCIYRAEKE